jgi:hypothetical protein
VPGLALRRTEKGDEALSGFAEPIACDPSGLGDPGSGLLLPGPGRCAADNNRAQSPILGKMVNV